MGRPLRGIQTGSCHPFGVRQWLQTSSQLRTGDAKASPGLPGGGRGVPKARRVAGLQRGAAAFKQGEASELSSGSQQPRCWGRGRKDIGSCWKKRRTKRCHIKSSGGGQRKTNAGGAHRILLWAEATKRPTSTNGKQ